MIWQPYARVSERGSNWHALGIKSSVADQLRECREYIDRHDAGATVLPPIVDEFECGRDLERPGIRRIMAELAGAAPWDNLIARDFDRVVWGMRSACELLEAVVRGNRGLVCLAQNWDYTTPQGRAFLLSNVVFAQYQREKTAEDTRKRMMGIARRGEWPAGKVPFGYRRPEKRSNALVVEPREAEQVRELFRRYAAGDSISRMVEIFGTPKNTLLKRLRNRIYTGAIPYGGEVFTGRHAAIVPVNLFDSVQVALPGKRTATRPNAQRYDYLLTGLVWCGCGSPMSPSGGTGKSGRMHPYYRCYSCRGCNVPAAVIEGAVVYALDRAPLLDSEIGEIVAEVRRMRDRAISASVPALAEVERALREAESESARIQRLFLDGVVTRDNAPVFNDRLAATTAEIERLRARRDELKVPDDLGVFEDAEKLARDLRSVAVAVAVAVAPTAKRQAIITRVSRIDRADANIYRMRYTSGVFAQLDIMATPRGPERTRVALGFTGAGSGGKTGR